MVRFTVFPERRTRMKPGEMKKGKKNFSDQQARSGRETEAERRHIQRERQRMSEWECVVRRGFVKTKQTALIQEGNIATDFP